MLTLGNDSILFCASLFSPYAALVGFLKFKQIEKNWSKLKNNSQGCCQCDIKYATFIAESIGKHASELII